MVVSHPETEEYATTESVWTPIQELDAMEGFALCVTHYFLLRAIRRRRNIQSTTGLTARHRTDATTRKDRLSKNVPNILTPVTCQRPNQTKRCTLRILPVSLLSPLCSKYIPAARKMQENFGSLRDKDLEHDPLLDHHEDIRYLNGSHDPRI
jgi:hypothetical protein